MNSIPQWWFVLSAAFFVVSTLAWLVITLLLVRVLMIINEIRPKLNQTMEKVDKVADQVQQLASSARLTVDSVGGKAKSVASGIELIALATASRFQLISKLLALAATGVKVAGMAQKLRAERQKVDKKALKQDNKNPHRGVEQSGSSSGS